MTKIGTEEKGPAASVPSENDLNDQALTPEFNEKVRNSTYEFINSFTDADDKQMAISRFKMPCDHMVKDA